jgi:hypothetical protein
VSVQGAPFQWSKACQSIHLRPHPSKMSIHASVTKVSNTTLDEGLTLSIRHLHLCLLVLIKVNQLKWSMNFIIRKSYIYIYILKMTLMMIDIYCT